MVIHPPVSTNVRALRREVCEAVRLHLCDYADERLWPRQRDDNNCVRDVLCEQYYGHSAAIMSFVLSYVGSEDVTRELTRM